MEEQRTWWEYLLLAVITIPLVIALVVGMYKQMNGRYGRKRNRRRW